VSRRGLELAVGRYCEGSVSAGGSNGDPWSRDKGGRSVDSGPPTPTIDFLWAQTKGSGHMSRQVC
jgi:hypothetical protein